MFTSQFCHLLSNLGKWTSSFFTGIIGRLTLLSFWSWKDQGTFLRVYSFRPSLNTAWLNTNRLHYLLLLLLSLPLLLALPTCICTHCWKVLYYFQVLWGNHWYLHFASDDTGVLKQEVKVLVQSHTAKYSMWLNSNLNSGFFDCRAMF